MSTWASTTISNQLTSKLSCNAASNCELIVNYPTPASTIDPKIGTFVNFINKDGKDAAQTFTTVDASGMRTIKVTFSVSTINLLNPVVATVGKQVTYSFPINIFLTNKCLDMGLVNLKGNINLQINSDTNLVFNTSSSMLTSNLPSCPPPGCTVSATFFLNQGICSDAACATVVASKAYKLNDFAYIKAILPDSLKSLKFKLYMATYAVLSSAGNVVYQSDNIQPSITETVNAAGGFNIEAWKIPVSTEIVGPNGQYSGNIRIISLNMFFTIVTGRNMRYLAGEVEVSKVLKTELTLESDVVLNGNNNVALPSGNNTVTVAPSVNNSTNTTTNKSSGNYIFMSVSLLIAIFAFLF
jgi:hypothetical protein